MIAFAWFVWQQRRLATKAAAQISTAEKVPGEIRTRADVVQAFHALSDHSEAVPCRWWTHRRAAEAIASAASVSNLSLQQLAAVYEQARYLPEDVALSGEQLQEVREALAECGVS